MAQGNNNNRDGNQGKSSERGFAAMDEQQRREIAAKGGEAVSADREHMAEIGRKGGEASSKKGGNKGSGKEGNSGGKR